MNIRDKVANMDLERSDYIVAKRLIDDSWKNFCSGWLFGAGLIGLTGAAGPVWLFAGAVAAGIATYVANTRLFREIKRQSITR